MKSLTAYIEHSSKISSLDDYIEEASRISSLDEYIKEKMISESVDTKKFADLFVKYWNKYEEQQKVSLDEGKKIFNEFKEILSKLQPKVKKYNFIQKLLGKKDPIISMSTEIDSVVDLYEHGFEICVDLPNKQHWDISFIYPWKESEDKSAKNDNVIFDKTQYEFYKLKHNSWKGKEKVEGQEYLVKIIDNDAVEIIQNLK